MKKIILMLALSMTAFASPDDVAFSTLLPTGYSSMMTSMRCGQHYCKSAMAVIQEEAAKYVAADGQIAISENLALVIEAVQLEYAAQNDGAKLSKVAAASIVVVENSETE